MAAFTVIAHYRTTEADARTVRDVLSRHAAASAAEPGCVTFTAHQHADDPTRFVLYEVYVDEAAFADHRATPHFRDNIEGIVVPLLLERTWAALSTIEPAAPPVIGHGAAGTRQQQAPGDDGDR